MKYTKGRGSLRSFAALVAGGLCLVLLAVYSSLDEASPESVPPKTPSPGRTMSGIEGAARAPAFEIKPPTRLNPKRANFGREKHSPTSRRMADWVVDSGDNRGRPFVIVDKADARIFVFNLAGVLRGAAPALLGLGRGDDSVPGIGDRELSSMRSEERTTPAGRFDAALGRNLRRESILWIDYDAAISVHRLRPGLSEALRGRALATSSPTDNHNTYGCVVVSVNFYLNVVGPAFTGMDGFAYVLSETRSLREVFKSFYEVE